ncbi:MAG: KH domain-containing protein [Candidatus Heimdallarchaeota archaeon]|nr:KH domain-containing protein [Candidatus Heimdallarchaeota archaeon]MDH5647083.1 KH domain-containing protein [Candidatus Heimdallarchaeota archaeon]
MSEFDDDNSSLFTQDTSQFIRIPLKRIGAVIGVQGKIRKQIENLTQSKIIIDSDTGEVEVRPKEDLTDPVKFMKASEIVKAIGRGFTPDQSMKLADDENFLEIIHLKTFLGNNPKKLARVRSRLIGTKGKIRSTIEQLTHTSIIISGGTVSIIGIFDNLVDARDSLIGIINGSKIESILGRLEEKNRQKKKEKDRLWKSEDEKQMAEDISDTSDEEDIFKDYN